MGTLSMTASDLHTKYHRPLDRCSDLLCGGTPHASLAGFSDIECLVGPVVAPSIIT
jgi:hypothetical protein